MASNADDAQPAKGAAGHAVRAVDRHKADDGPHPRRARALLPVQVARVEPVRPLQRELEAAVGPAELVEAVQDRVPPTVADLVLVETVRR